MKYSALQKKFVVNEQNGEMIGFISDLDLNSHSLCIESIIVKEPKNLLQKLLKYFNTYILLWQVCIIIPF